MDVAFLNQKHTERITEWVTGGPYAVAVPVEVTIYPERLDAPCLSRETVLYLEKLAKLAEAGDIEALKAAGTVYVKLGEPAALTTGELRDGSAKEKRETTAKLG